MSWTALARPQQTLVFYMGVANAGEISDQLQRHGLCGETPVAVIERGTTSRQRVSRTRLDRLVEHIDGAAILPPALLIIGAVAGTTD